MSVEHDATVVVIAVLQYGQFPGDQKRGRYALENKKLADLTGMDPDRLDDAVDILENSGYLVVLRLLGTSPFGFKQASLTAEGRAEAERIVEARGGADVLAESGLITPLAEQLMSEMVSTFMTTGEFPDWHRFRREHRDAWGALDDELMGRQLVNVWMWENKSWVRPVFRGLAVASRKIVSPWIVVAEKLVQAAREAYDRDGGPDKDWSAEELAEIAKVPEQDARRALTFLLDAPRLWAGAGRDGATGAAGKVRIAEGVFHFRGVAIELDSLRDGMLEERRQADDGEEEQGRDTVEQRVFIVHGHDELMKQEVARFVERLKLEAVILHEQPNRGATIIEKLEKHAATAGFAIVLLSEDDVGGKTPAELKPRARQNVILELGLFIALLGRPNVVVLHKGAVEVPSDMHGVLYLAYKDIAGVRADLMKEMQAAGLTFNPSDGL